MYQILVVDDMVENIDILSGLLKDTYKIKVALNGEVALRVAEKTLPDLILLDIMMPGMDGYQVCRLLKQNPFTRNIPVIFVTAKDQEMDEVMGFECGAVDYINKPINPTITMSRIKTHIALSDQKKALEIEVLEKTREINDTRLQIIKKLSLAAEYKDSDIGLHIERMSRYSYHLAREYGLDKSLSQLLLSASPMHDIGKIGIPDSILKKPGRLDKEEWALMTRHAQIGHDIIGDSPSELLQTAQIVAGQHHEKWNGKGYPQGLAGEEISIFARIVAVADVFDALTNRRPYKEAWRVEDAVHLIQDEKEEHFDPEVVDSFLHVLPKLLEVKDRFKG